jgi:hypothetical protein
VAVSLTVVQPGPERSVRQEPPTRGYCGAHINKNAALSATIVQLIPRPVQQPSMTWLKPDRTASSLLISIRQSPWTVAYNTRAG